MSVALVCPRGHRWRWDGDRTIPSPPQEPRCPECGEPALRSPLAPAANGSRLDSTQDADTHLPDAPTLPPFCSAPAVSPRIAIPGYEFREIIGQGGMSVVYRARDQELQRDVAVKMLLSGIYAHSAQRARFLNEARALAALQHPHIVQIHRVGEHEGMIYLALELVEGGSLAQFLREHVLAPKVAAEIIESLARTVHHAHQHGILHRDLKPANVLLSVEFRARGRELKSGRVSLTDPESGLSAWGLKITDFGLAHRIDGEALTHMGDVLGTPAYMSPEQARGRTHEKELGPPTDVYGLGAMLYELLTGRPPFRGETTLETLDQVIVADPVSPRQVQPRTPRDLETICLKCLEKTPARRYATALALAEDLKCFREHRPIVARRSSWLERAAKWVRRFPTRAALITVCALAATLAITGTLIHNALLSDEVQRAEANATQARAEQQRATASYRAAHNTFRKMIGRLQSESYSGLPKVNELHRQQLEDSLEFYETVMQELGNAPGVASHDLAVATLDAGYVHLVLERDTAVVLLRQAAGLFAALQAEEIEVPGAAWNHAVAINYLGMAEQRRNDYSAAEACHRQAVTLWTEQVWKYPENADARRLLAGASHTLASLLQRQKRLLEAEEEYQRAVQTLHGLAQDPAQRAEVERLIAEVLVNLALLQQSTGHGDEARRNYQLIELRLAPHLQRYPHDHDAAVSLATAYTNWAHLLRAEGKAQEALPRVNEAVRLAEDLRRRGPVTASAQSILEKALGTRSLVQGDLGRRLEALQDFDRLVELSVLAERVEYRWGRLSLLLDARQHGRAAAEARELVALPNVPLNRQFMIAQVLARSINGAMMDQQLSVEQRTKLVQQYGDEAFSQLQKVRAAGWFDVPENLAAYKVDGSFNGLLLREEYQKLRADILAGKKAPAREF